jgi:hypothetical protein
VGQIGMPRKVPRAMTESISLVELNFQIASGCCPKSITTSPSTARFEDWSRVYGALTGPSRRMPQARPSFLSTLVRSSPLSALRLHRRPYIVGAGVSDVATPKCSLDRVENVHDPTRSTSVIDSIIMKEFPRFATTCTPFGDLVEQYDKMSGNVLNFSLPYEPSPVPSRGVRFDRTNDAVVMVAHVASDAFEHKVSLCSGFAIDVRGHKNSVIVSCAHTLEMVFERKRHQLYFQFTICLRCVPMMFINLHLPSLPRLLSRHPCKSILSPRFCHRFLDPIWYSTPSRLLSVPWRPFL